MQLPKKPNSSKQNPADAPSVSAIIAGDGVMSRDRSRKVGSMSNGITRSYEPIGTIARGDPLVDVLKMKRCAPRRLP